MSAAPDSPPVLRFARGLVGFPTAQRFRLVPVAEADEGLYRLVCLDAELEFVAAAPPVFFPEYAPEIDDETAGRLELDAAEDALALVLLTLAEPVEHSTANLLAPIVVNTRTRAAAQVVLPGPAAAIRSPLPTS